MLGTIIAVSNKTVINFRERLKCSIFLLRKLTDKYTNAYEIKLPRLCVIINKINTPKYKITRDNTERCSKNNGDMAISKKNPAELGSENM